MEYLWDILDVLAIERWEAILFAFPYRRLCRHGVI